MRRLGWIIGTAAIVLLAVMLAPRRSYQPGPLMAAHAQLVGQCAACHRAWHGPVSNRCVACHGDITDVNPHGSMDMSDELTAAPHGVRMVLDADNYLTCLSCHGEHEGRVVDIAATAAFACTWCHKHPSIGGVPEHTTPVMARPASPKNTFSQPFNHALHKALIEAHQPPRPGGFACASCHIVKPVTPPQNDAMSFRWDSCAGSGCHIAPQDTYLKLPQSVGTDPATLAYTARVFHMNAVFIHSAGHLTSPCATCHTRIAASSAPDDDASLTVAQCFTCHAHQIPRATLGTVASAKFDVIQAHESFQRMRFNAGQAGRVPLIAWLAEGIAMAADTSRVPSDNTDRRVTACGQCHLFHHHGVILANDFHTPAPKFPPNRPMHLYVTLYFPSLNPGRGLSLQAARVSPWWLGVLGVLVSSLGFLVLPMLVPSKVAAGEIVMEVAPQPTPEVPLLDDTFQTSVRHLYIVGEAAGTASINLAMRSGRQVIEAVAAELKRIRPIVQPDLYDVAIVGCGPAGLGATATAQVMGLKYVTLEKMTPASTLRAYPRAKFVQATPIDIEEYGTFFLEGDNSREELIKEWERIIAHLKLTINDREEVVEIIREPELLRLRTARQHIFSARCVVLAIGVRGNPRHLNMPGDEPGRVHYMLIDAEEYRDRDILVVGGGNAGAEVAQALAATPLGNRVSYSFRATVLANVSRENAEKIGELQRSRTINVYPGTALAAIKPGKVVLAPANSGPGAAAARGGMIKEPIELSNDLIFALIGAKLPTGFLKQAGIRMGSKGRFAMISS